MPMSATDDMRRVVEGLIKDKRITVSMAEYARANGFSDADIIAARERVRLSQARLEIQGSPLRYKPDKQADSDGGSPTPERLKKGGGYLKRRKDEGDERGDANVARRYQLRSVMDMHGDKLMLEHRTAFQAFVSDAELHKRIRVADLNSSGGGGGQRLGGLGNVPDEIRDRHNRYEWVSKRLTRLEQEVCDVLVTHCMTKRDGTPFSTEEYGALIFPMLGDRSFHRGAAVNAFRHLVDHLVQLYHDPLCPRVRSKRKLPLEIGG